MVEIKGKVENVTIKNGTSNKGSWTKYSFIINDEWYSAFGEKPIWLVDGVRVKLTFTEKGQFKNIDTIIQEMPEGTNALDQLAGGVSNAVVNEEEVVEDVKKSVNPALLGMLFKIADEEARNIDNITIGNEKYKDVVSAKVALLLEAYEYTLKSI